jgi:hypothetical protein
MRRCGGRRRWIGKHRGRLGASVGRSDRDRKKGSPDARVRAALDAMDAIEPLERLSQRLLKVESWEELLAAP